MILDSKIGAGKIVLIGVSLEALIVLFCVLTQGVTLEALQTITRFSGRLSLLAFSLILLLYDKPGAVRLDRAFLLFAILHGIHLIELLSYVALSGVELIPTRVAGGFVAYAMIFAMPVINARKEEGRISVSTYNRIEDVFFLYVWLIFFLTYLPRVMGKLPNVGGTHTEHVVLFSWVVLLGLIKTIEKLGPKFSS
ncbi:hypothetical protein WSM22_26150 [Cytophagales bacterium WSM2-2]|nr:hypothetical protein WSM22_26150 [Cytophagales bacterium WSM2-2]